MLRLSAYQSTLAAAIRGDANLDEARSALGPVSILGLAATGRIRRSWCRARAARAASLTLSALPRVRRAELLDAWVKAGGGARSFFEQEADAFLAFLAARLEEPSHQRALCLFERAIVRAGAAAQSLPDRALVGRNTPLRRSPHAALVRLGAPIGRLLTAIDGAEAWPDFDPAGPILLVAPGVEGRARDASEREIALWRAAEAGAPAGDDLPTALVMVAGGALLVSAP